MPYDNPYSFPGTPDVPAGQPFSPLREPSTPAPSPPRRRLSGDEYMAFARNLRARLASGCPNPSSPQGPIYPTAPMTPTTSSRPFPPPSPAPPLPTTPTLPPRSPSYQTSSLTLRAMMPIDSATRPSTNYSGGSAQT